MKETRAWSIATFGSVKLLSRPVAHAAVAGGSQLVMHDEPMEDWVTFRLALMFLDRRGRLRSNAKLRDRATRVALIIDLALRDRLLSTDAGLSIDTASTGYPPADALLDYVLAHPNRPVIDIINKAPITTLDVLRAHSDPPERQHSKRGIVVDHDLATQQKQRLDAALETGVADSATTAALVMIAGAVELCYVSPASRFAEQCETTSALVADCITYLNRLTEKLALISNANLGRG